MNKSKSLRVEPEIKAFREQVARVHGRLVANPTPVVKGTRVVQGTPVVQGIEQSMKAEKMDRGSSKSKFSPSGSGEMI